VSFWWVVFPVIKWNIRDKLSKFLQISCFEFKIPRFVVTCFCFYQQIMYVKVICRIPLLCFRPWLRHPGPFRGRRMSEIFPAKNRLIPPNRFTYTCHELVFIIGLGDIKDISRTAVNFDWAVFLLQVIFCKRKKKSDFVSHWKLLCMKRGLVMPTKRPTLGWN
jgi:hypothetical protein